MTDLQELNIIMVGPRGVGKTSFLAAMHEKFKSTFWDAGLNTWVADTTTLDRLEDCKTKLRNMDGRLRGEVDFTPPDDPKGDKGFLFDMGSRGKKFVRVRFSDYSGEFFESTDGKQREKEYVREQLRQCDAVIIPIDSTALMERKTGKVGLTEIGEWHQEVNDAEHVTTG